MVWSDACVAGVDLNVWKDWVRVERAEYVI